MADRCEYELRNIAVGPLLALSQEHVGEYSGNKGPPEANRVYVLKILLEENPPCERGVRTVLISALRVIDSRNTPPCVQHKALQASEPPL